MKKSALLLTLACAFFTQARADQTNLIPGGDLSDKTNPMKGVRTDFPYEPWYAKNVGYVKIATDKKSKNGGNCLVVELPPGIAGNEGGKVETVFVKCEPGASYRAEIDVMTNDFGAKVHAEAWFPDPRPTEKRDKFRTPALEQYGVPALVMVHRWQFHDAPGGSKTWTTLTQEITVPKTVKVNMKGVQGASSTWQEVPPQYLTLKVVFFAGTPNGGKSYVSNFRLYKK